MQIIQQALLASKYLRSWHLGATTSWTTSAMEIEEAKEFRQSRLKDIFYKPCSDEQLTSFIS